MLYLYAAWCVIEMFRQARSLRQTKSLRTGQINRRGVSFGSAGGGRATGTIY